MRYIWSLFVKRKLPNHLLPNEQSEEMKHSSELPNTYGYRFTQRAQGDPDVSFAHKNILRHDLPQLPYLHRQKRHRTVGRLLHVGVDTPITKDVPAWRSCRVLHGPTTYWTLAKVRRVHLLSPWMRHEHPWWWNWWTLGWSRESTGWGGR